ncbi:hypothetical protein FRB94_000237 [Tulasnella sp. JGI-2019a]|nr:hypothetical protein FRB94_000237 [Tulasnella sp. JGI-2019a]KAG9015305.1 hypothetical protein FRB93_013005 [Tulasnella sp. JGI-2019a]
MDHGLLSHWISQIRRSGRLLHSPFDDVSDADGSIATLDYTLEELQGNLASVSTQQNQGYVNISRAIWIRSGGRVQLPVVIKSWPLRPKPRQQGSMEEALDACVLRMVREARTWRSLSHPNIVTLYGWKIHGPDNNPCVIMPSYQNGDLAHFVSRAKPSNTERLQLLMQVADALIYMHKPRSKHGHPIVHGDIKASNVLLSDDTPKRALLADFGAARIADGPGGTTELNTSSQNGGTVGYKAPERYEPEHDASKRRVVYKPITASDVYSFGGLVLEVLSGVAPFQGKKREQWLISSAVITNKTSPRNEHPAVPANATAWELMERCWTFEPKRRPTMSQVHEFLKAEYDYVRVSGDRLRCRA